MGAVDDRLAELGLELPAPMEPPPGIGFSFEPVQQAGPLAYVSGHGPTDGQRTLSAGKVGAEVDLAGAVEAARRTGLAILASLERALGDLDRVGGWVKALGMVNCAPGFNSTPAVINGFSDLVLEIWGERGRHARSAIGVAELPFDWPVEVEAIVAIDG